MFDMVKSNLSTMLYMYKKRLAIFIIIPILFAVINPQNGFFPLFMLMGSVMMLAVPEMEGRDKVYMTILSMPVKRDEYVYGKFISIVVWLIIVVAFGILIDKGLTFVMSARMAMTSLLSIKVMFATMSIALCMYMLIFFCFGAKTSRIAYYVFFFLIIFSYSALGVDKSENVLEKFSFVTDFMSSTSIINNVIYIVILFAVIGILSILTAAIYDKKDL